MVRLGGSTNTLSKILPSRALPPQELIDVLGEMYETLLREDRWPDVLGHLAELFEAADAAFVEWSGDFKEVRSFVSGRRVYTPESERLFLNHYGRIDPSIAMGRLAPVGAAANCVDVFKPEFVAQDEYYQGHLLPQSLRYRIAIKALGRDDRAAFLFVFRHPEQGPFELEHMQLLAHLDPHFRRLALLHYERRQLQQKRDEALDLLDRQPYALATTGADGRLRTLNKLASKYISDADGLVLSAGFVEALRPDVTQQLRAMIADACDLPARRSSDGSLRLPRPGGKPPLICLVTAGNVTPERQPYAVLSIADATLSPAMTGRHLIELYGLTQAEARLACDLLEGQTVDTIAATRGVATPTVRTQLASTLRKCGVQRQVDLVRLLCRIPGTVPRI